MFSFSVRNNGTAFFSSLPPLPFPFLVYISQSNIYKTFINITTEKKRSTFTPWTNSYTDENANAQSWPYRYTDTHGMNYFSLFTHRHSLLFYYDQICTYTQLSLLRNSSIICLPLHHTHMLIKVNARFLQSGC